jgi:hypothetical protein
MAYRTIFGTCDCCDARNRVLHYAEVTGIETYGCAECKWGGHLSDDLDDLEDEIERCLEAKPKTGEQLAHIAALEAALVEARADFEEVHGQFGVGS